MLLGSQVISKRFDGFLNSSPFKVSFQFKHPKFPFYEASQRNLRKVLLFHHYQFKYSSMEPGDLKINAAGVYSEAVLALPGADRTPGRGCGGLPHCWGAVALP